MGKFDEQLIGFTFQKNNIDAFQKIIENYDNDISSNLLINGYKKINKADRTVIFSFGEVTITRNRWYKNGKCYIPVDEYLGLEKHSRYSKELMYKIACL